MYWPKYWMDATCPITLHYINSSYILKSVPTVVPGLYTHHKTKWRLPPPKKRSFVASHFCHGCSDVDRPGTASSDCFGDSDEIQIQSNCFKTPVRCTGDRRRWDLWNCSNHAEMCRNHSYCATVWQIYEKYANSNNNNLTCYISLQDTMEWWQ